MRLLFSPQSATDLEDIGDYIARDNPLRAISFIDEIVEHCQQLIEMPESFPMRNDLAKGLRMMVHGQYLILYRIIETDVRIERIVHGSRKLKKLVKSIPNL